jgi:hypothetical protein
MTGRRCDRLNSGPSILRSQVGLIGTILRTYARHHNVGVLQEGGNGQIRRELDLPRKAPPADARPILRDAVFILMCVTFLLRDESGFP